MKVEEETQIAWYLSEIFFYPNKFGNKILDTYANGVPLEEIFSSLRGTYSMREKFDMLEKMRKKTNFA